MQKQEPIIRNRFGEKLDTWVESNGQKIKTTVIMVHGFGTDKHETAKYFDDISSALVRDGYRVVRFDLSGYGKSEGTEDNACYSKHVEDLQIVIDYVASSYSEPINIFAQSMGCFVTALTQPCNISKIIMTGIPNSNTQAIIDRVVKRFGSRPGAKLDLDGISLLPRSTGQIQKIGSRFWSDIKKLRPVQEIDRLSHHTDLHIIHWKSDEVLGTDYLDEYDQIKTLRSYWLPGNHSVTNKEDRDNFIQIMLNIYRS
jgi:putative redox protein